MDDLVSIIIINYKTIKLTCNCIDSILDKVKTSNYEIIVVDNASRDDSVQIIRQKYHDRIKLIESSENLGFGRANNLGIKYATGKYLFFLNSDTVLINNPLPYFIKFYSSHQKNAGAVGAYLLDGQKGYSLSGGNTYSQKKYLNMALNSYFRRKKGFEIANTGKIQQVDYVIGADLFIDKDIFLKTGGFDSHIFMYFEDVELGYRIGEMGYANYLIPGPEIIHYEKASSNSQFSRLYNTGSLMYCIRKKSGTLKFRIFQSLYFILKFPIIFKFKNFKNNLEYILSIFRYKKYLAE